MFSFPTLFSSRASSDWSYCSLLSTGHTALSIPSLLPSQGKSDRSGNTRVNFSSGLDTNMGNQFTDIAPNTTFLPNLQSLHIVVIGLDNAGKTSLLYRLKLREFVEAIPTKGFNMERIKVPMGNSKVNTSTFQVWDVGGQEKLRPLWKSYTRRTDGLVFVVDAAEAERMEEAKMELHRISRSAENLGVPVLVLANKQDLESAMSASEVIHFYPVRFFIKLCSDCYDWHAHNHKAMLLLCVCVAHMDMQAKFRWQHLLLF